MNVGGKLYTLVYGDISSMSANPIEKKPFFHFWPGSWALTIGTWSCNFTCPWCQNYDISKTSPQALKANYVSPEKFASFVGYENCQGCSISFNEPTMLFEYSLDVFPLTHEKKLYNTYVSNGYMTSETLRMLRAAGLDAIKFDVKGNEEAVRRYCDADVNVVWRNVGEAKRLGMHVEVVTLVIPKVNDDIDCLREIARRHLKEAGPESPLHFSQFYPTYEMTDRPRTPVDTLEKAHNIATKEGVQYVYAGNIPGHRLENTYCPACGELLISRHGFAVTKYMITKNKRCPRCGLEIPIIGEYVKCASFRRLL
jgi:pyruvate formate lyase activating enzyme